MSNFFSKASFKRYIISVPVEILQLIPLILQLILPLIQQSQKPDSPAQVIVVQPSPAPTAAAPVALNQESDHHHHHHHLHHPILNPFALHPLAFYDYAMFGDPLFPFRTDDKTVQILRNTAERKGRTIVRMKTRSTPKSKMVPRARQMTNSNKKQLLIRKVPNQLSSSPRKKVPALSKPRRTKKRLTKKRVFTKTKHHQYPRKPRNKIQFRRQFSLPGKQSSVFVSSFDLMRGVTFAFRGKSYKLTLRQMINVLRRKNLLRDRKIKPKIKKYSTHRWKYQRNNI